MYTQTHTHTRVSLTCGVSLAALALALCHSLLLACGPPLLIADLMTGVRQVHLRVRVRQAVGNQLQLQVLIILAANKQTIKQQTNKRTIEALQSESRLCSPTCEHPPSSVSSRWRYCPILTVNSRYLLSTAETQRRSSVRWAWPLASMLSASWIRRWTFSWVC